MAAPSLRAVAVRSGPLATLAPSCLAAAWAPLLSRTDLAARGAAGFSSSSAAAAAAGGGGSSGPDAFTAALQQKTEEELRQLALKQAQPDVGDDAEAAADEGQQSKDAQPPHGKREIGGYKGPEPTRYSRAGASDWEVKGRVTDF